MGIRRNLGHITLIRKSMSLSCVALKMRFKPVDKLPTLFSSVLIFFSWLCWIAHCLCRFALWHSFATLSGTLVGKFERKIQKILFFPTFLTRFYSAKKETHARWTYDTRYRCNETTVMAIKRHWFIQMENIPHICISVWSKRKTALR